MFSGRPIVKHAVVEDKSFINIQSFQNDIDDKRPARIGSSESSDRESQLLFRGCLMDSFFS
ncbi:hypothetical protein SAMN02745781_00171 [Vibrio gazogenes DSM 21264]|uniref:Uncharacterized protein n=1 Tax=Vibrio gazogenes DSM 21264 = NBRC 103151 TaxID=1123492 RepID=A0A1M4SVE6_VIBGA|nr:hypothetical protein SAMN02745781_00171 [Vibrio gazogenes DSM 21264] [Vibrio gazogenes DSM 21264 = NBRC 103151]SJN54775.1 hypothetical protein BQ6471_01199 [Vibrio gazogenes]